MTHLFMSVINYLTFYECNRYYYVLVVRMGFKLYLIDPWSISCVFISSMIHVFKVKSHSLILKFSHKTYDSL